MFENVKAYFARKPLWWFIAASLALHILRQPQQLIHPQFWAEDGTNFFVQNYNYGLGVFFSTVGGYLHFWPRIGAFLAGLLPLPWVPFGTKIFSLATHAILAGIMASPRFPGRHGQKAMMILLIAILPQGGEVYMNLCNTNSFSCMILIAATVLTSARTTLGRSMEFLGFLILAGTGPFVLFLFPLLFLYWILTPAPKWSFFGRALGVVTGLSLQLLNFSLASRERQDFNPAFDVWIGAVQRTFKSLIFAKIPFPFWLESLAALLVFGALVYCFWPLLKLAFSKTPSPFKYASVFFLTCAALNMAVSMVFARVYLHVLGPYLGAPRYFFPTYLLILCVLVLIWNEPRVGRLARALVAVSIFCSLLNFTSTSTYRDLDWPGQVREFERSSPRVMNILPPGTTFVLERRN